MRKIKLSYIHLFIFLITSIGLIGLGYGFHDNLHLSADGFFHFGRFKYLLENVKNLHFFNDFYIDNYLFEMGYPVGVFYPQGTMYLFVLPSAILGFSASQGYIMMMVLLIFLTLISFYYAFISLFKNVVYPIKVEHMAFLGAFLFILIPSLIPVDGGPYKLSSYFILNLYVRMSVGELTAMIFFPWIIVGLKELFYQKSRGFTLLFALLGVLYSHILSGLFAGGIVLIYVAVHWRKIIHEKEIFFSLLKVCIWFLLIGSYQIIPMVEFMLFQDYGYNVPFFNPGSLFYMANMAGKGNPTAIYTFFQVLIGILLLALLMKTKTIEQKYLTLSFIGIYIASKLFPWQLFEDTPLTIIQFPFRFSFLFALFISLSVPLFLKEVPKQVYLVLSVLILSILFMLNLRPILEMKTTYDVSLNEINQRHPHTLFIGIGAEYLPDNFDITGLNKQAGFGYSFTLTKMTEIYEKAVSDPYLLPVFFHKGYQITNKNKENVIFEKGYSGLIQTKTPHLESELHIQRKRSFLQNVSFIVTILASAFFGFQRIKSKKG